jgi:hypothetical protein
MRNLGRSILAGLHFKTFKNMELINRANADVIAQKQTNHLAMLTIRNDRVIYLTYAAVSKFGLTAGNFIHIFNDQGRWYFFTNSNPTGFPMYRARTEEEKRGFNVFSTALIRMMLAKIPHAQIKHSFKITETNREYEGDKVFEILVDKPIINRT